MLYREQTQCYQESLVIIHNSEIVNNLQAQAMDCKAFKTV